MPRLSHSAPAYRRHRASGQAVVTIQGKDHYLGPYGSKSSKLEYDRLIGEWLAAGRPTLPPAAPTEISVVEVLTRFRKWADGFYRKNGRRTGTAELFKPTLQILKQRYGNCPAIEVGPLAVKAIIEALIEEGRTRYYVVQRVAQIKRIFKWAVSEELIPHDAYMRLTTVEAPRKGKTKAKELPPITPVEDAAIEATLTRLPQVVADMVRLQRFTGARPGEVCQLRPADVDRSTPVWRYVPQEHKTEHRGKARVILIGPKAQAVLAPYLLRDAESYCFNPTDSEKKRRTERSENRVTPIGYGNRPGTNRKRRPKRRAGYRYQIASYRRAIARAAKEAGVESWSPNQLRHAAATELRRVYGIEAAQVVLGHSELSTTQIYAERNIEKAAEIMAKLG